MVKNTRVVLSVTCFFLTVLGATAQLPSSYDARDDGLVTSVKDQSHLGACWAFSSTSILETGYIKAGLGSAANTDFSEWQMANYAHPQSWNGYEDPYHGGLHGWGSRTTDPIHYAQAQFSSVFTKESDAPYPLSQIAAHETLTPSPRQLPALGDAVVSTYGFSGIGGDTLSTGELQTRKNQILSHGSVATGISWSWGAISTNEGNVVYNRTTEAIVGGHAITLVGWDDSVRVNDTQQGAFLVKNSWAEDWGNDGYFYLAYDSYLGAGSTATWLDVKDASHLTSAFSTVPELDGADENYFIDHSSASAIAAKMSLDPIRSDDDMIVSLGLNTYGGEFEIKLYGSEEDALGNGTGDSLFYDAFHTFADSGFQMIDLTNSVDVSQADEVWVVCEAAAGSDAWTYEFSEGALTNDYSYSLNGDVWEGSSTTGNLAAVSFYMIPEPSTFALLLSVSGGLLFLRRLRM
jgi:hypothetical protein